MTGPSCDEHVAVSRETVKAAGGGGFDELVLDLEHWYRVARKR